MSSSSSSKLIQGTSAKEVMKQYLTEQGFSVIGSAKKGGNHHMSFNDKAGNLYDLKPSDFGSKNDKTKKWELDLSGFSAAKYLKKPAEKEKKKDNPPKVDPPIKVEPPTVSPPTVSPPIVSPPTVVPPIVSPPTVVPPEPSDDGIDYDADYVHDDNAVSALFKELTELQKEKTNMFGLDYAKMSTSERDKKLERYMEINEEIQLNIEYLQQQGVDIDDNEFIDERDLFERVVNGQTKPADATTPATVLKQENEQLSRDKEELYRTTQLVLKKLERMRQTTDTINAIKTFDGNMQLITNGQYDGYDVKTLADVVNLINGGMKAVKTKVVNIDENKGMALVQATLQNVENGKIVDGDKALLTLSLDKIREATTPQERMEKIKDAYRVAVDQIEHDKLMKGLTGKAPKAQVLKESTPMDELEKVKFYKRKIGAKKLLTV